MILDGGGAATLLAVVVAFVQDEREFAIELGEGRAQGALQPWVGAAAKVAAGAEDRASGQLPDAVAREQQPEGQEAYAEHHDSRVLDAQRYAYLLSSPVNQLRRATMQHVWGAAGRISLLMGTHDR